MDKEEILKKSRAESKDEGEEHAIAEGAKWGFFGMAIMYFLLIAMIMFFEGVNSVALMPLHGIFWLGLGLAELGKASVKQEKLLRFSGIVKTIIGIAYALAYIVVLALKFEPRW